MIHLNDDQHPEKVIELEPNEEFISFVDQTQCTHNASIMVLLFNKKNKMPYMRKFTYCDPFEKKDFESDDGWSLNEEVKISNNVVQKMKAIFFGETMSMSLATSLRAMINQE